MKHWSAVLVKLGACGDAVAWAKTHPSAAQAWASCERGDWLLWYAGKVAGPPGHTSRRKLVLAACACARLSLKQVQVAKGELRPLRAIGTAEAWARGGKGAPSLEDVRSAAYAAYAYADAAAAAYDAAAYAAAAAAASAAAADSDSAYAADAYAADAAYAAAYAAAAAAADAAASAADAADAAASAAAYAAADAAAARKKMQLKILKCGMGLLNKVTGVE